MNTYKIKTGQRIRYFRRKNGLTQKELGILMGFSQSTAEVRMNQYETGVRSMKIDKLERLAEILQIDKSALCVPAMDKLTELMQLLFALEDCGLVNIVKTREQCFLQLDMLRAGFADGEKLLETWQEKNELLTQGKISEEEYDAWRYGGK